MLTLTSKAVEKVKDVIASQDEPAQILGIRVSVVGGGCSGFQYAMNLERESHDGDTSIPMDGFQVMVDETSLPLLRGAEIDFVDTPQGSGFRFKNPNAKSTCGCGDSFHA